MEIILNEEDLKKLIKDSYTGITDIKFSTKKLKITLTTNGEIFKQIQPKVKPEVKVVKHEPTELQEEVLPIEARMGLMRSGNEQDRAVLRIG